MLAEIFILICVAFSVYIFVDVRTTECYSRFSGLGSALCAFVCSALLASLFYSLSLEICARWYTEEDYIVFENSISSLEMKTENSSYLHGTFILGCGTVDGQNKSTTTFAFFSNTKYGKQLQTLSNSDEVEVFVQETDDEEPCLKTIYKKKYFTGILEKLYGRAERNDETGKILVVPTNTIKVNYNVDLGGM